MVKNETLSLGFITFNLTANNTQHKFSQSELLKNVPAADMCSLYGSEIGCAEAVAYFLEKNGTALINNEYYGTTPLQVAVHNGHTAVVELLLKNGAKNVADKKNKEATPFG